VQSVAVMTRLQELLESAVSDGTVPGAAALVARGDRVEVASAGELEPDSIVRLASTTKPIMAATQTALHLSKGAPVHRIGVMAAFGCNYQGDIAPALVVKTLEDGLDIAKEAGTEIKTFSLADTMGWATPDRIERVLGEVRSRWPQMELALHLHDTRGLAVANAHAALRMGVKQFDATAGGLGGCPFAGQKGAAGNICTEELVLLCEEMGIRTGVDLDKLIEVGRMAEEIVGHQLPSELIHAGSLDAFRRKAA